MSKNHFKNEDDQSYLSFSFVWAYRLTLTLILIKFTVADGVSWWIVFAPLLFVGGLVVVLLGLIFLLFLTTQDRWDWTIDEKGTFRGERRKSTSD